MAPWRLPVTPSSPWVARKNCGGQFTSQNIIDGNKTLIMPGLINSHTHAAHDLLPGHRR
jgi:cytosine/adenosine deaminase-related metal-dependent hydrolase